MLKRLLLLSVCLYSVAAFATATDGRIQCEENLSGLNCMVDACTEMTKIQNVNSKADYDNIKSKWYDKIKDKCKGTELQKLYDKATQGEAVFKISIPKSSVATTRHYINLKLNPEKIPVPEGKFTFFLFPTTETLDEQNFKSSAKRLSENCSDSFESDPWDNDEITSRLKGKAINGYSHLDNVEFFAFQFGDWHGFSNEGLKYWGGGTEYFMGRNSVTGLLAANYGKNGSYSNKILVYENYAEAETVYNTIFEALKQPVYCSGYYLLLVTYTDDGIHVIKKQEIK